MRKLILLVLILLTWYLSAMFQSLPLQVLCMTEILLFPLSVLLLPVLSRGLKAVFPAESLEVLAGQETESAVLLRRPGILPINSLQLRLRLGYAGDWRRETRRLSGSCAPRGDRVPWAFTLPYCGLALAQVDRLWVRDWLQLFSLRRKQRAWMRILVFPEETALQIHLSRREDRRAARMQQEVPMTAAGADRQDTRQLREYREGDSARDIHWKLSARTDTLWIREPVQDRDTEVLLRLEQDDWRKLDRRQKSGFYTLLQALVTGLLRQVSLVRVCRRENGVQLQETVSSLAECRELLGRLYLLDAGGAVPEAGMNMNMNMSRSAGRSAEADRDGSRAVDGLPAFRLTATLEWYLGEDLIHAFSLRTLEEEIQERQFVLGAEPCG